LFVVPLPWGVQEVVYSIGFPEGFVYSSPLFRGQNIIYSAPALGGPGFCL
jgi:hypothetical protein